MGTDTKVKESVIVSACFTGMRCVNYPSLIFEDGLVKKLLAEGRAIPLCSEQIGGLPTPRPPVGFSGGTAKDLWTGVPGLRMLSTDNDDFTEQFMRGAREVLRIAKLAGVTKAILHNGSPSCGVTETSVFDEHGSLKGGAGCGVLTWLLEANGINIYTPDTWGESGEE
jgi:uncharacterized protein YbbK (DUF523 family)